MDKPDYKNWMPKGMIWSFAAGTAVSLTVMLIVDICWLKTALAALTVILAGITAWTVLMYRAFSYTGTRQMSRRIIEGVAHYIRLPNGGRCLDVGCGSGALAIAVAKRNLQGSVTGIDRWGTDYASFSQKLCMENAKAEGVAQRTDFAPGNALKLDFPDGCFDAVTSNYVYHNIPSRNRQAILMETLRVLKKGGTFAIHDIFSRQKYGDMQAFVERLKEMGYEQVELIPTDGGRFMSKWESQWMGLKGSAILVGKK